MKTAKKLISLILALALASGLIIAMPLSANAEEHTVNSISATLPKKMIQNTNGYWNEYIDSNNDSHDYYMYELWIEEFDFSVVYDTTETFEGDYTEFEEFFGDAPKIAPESYQSWDHQYTVGINEIKMTYKDILFSTQIEIAPNPVEGFTAVPTTTFIQYRDLATITSNDHTWQEYDPTIIDFEYTVTYDGGKTFVGNYEEIKNKFGGSTSFNTSEPTENWVGGYDGYGERSINLYFMGFKYTAYVNVLKCPIETITATPAYKLLQNDTGWWSEENNEEGVPEEFFNYNILPSMFILDVTYNNGQHFTGTADELEEELGFSLYTWVLTEQSLKNQLKLGENDVTLRVCGIPVTAKFEVVESVIESISAVSDRTYIENCDGYVDTYIDLQGTEHEFFNYSIDASAFEYTITYDGGKTLTGSWDDIMQVIGYHYDFEIQKPSPDYYSWGVGKHDVSISFAGATCTAEIEVVECPIESLTATPTEKYYENLNTYYNWDVNAFPRYTISDDDFIYTVTLKDGKEIEFTSDNRPAMFGQNRYIQIDPNASEEHPFTVGGDNTVTISYLGKQTTAKVELLPNPIESISAQASSVLYKDIDSIRMNYNPITYDTVPEYDFYDVDISFFNFKVTYDGGKTFEGTYDEVYRFFTALYGEAYNNRVLLPNDEYTYHLGKNNATVYFLGYTIPAEVVVEENPYTQLSVSGKNSLTLSLTRANGTVDTMPVLDITNVGTYYSNDYTPTYRIATASKCFLNAHLTGADSGKNFSIKLGTLNSNELAENYYYKTLYAAKNAIWDALPNILYPSGKLNGFIPFNGTVNESNIDKAIIASICISNIAHTKPIDTINGKAVQKWTFEEISKSMSDSFIDGDAAIKASSYYNSEENIFVVPALEYFSSYYNTKTQSIVYNEDTDSIFAECIYVVNGEDVKLTLSWNTDGKLVNITSSVRKGDTDGNGNIQLGDAMKAFQHVAKKITLEGAAFTAADIDGNGKIELSDAMKIFQFVAKKISSF